MSMFDKLRDLNKLREVQSSLNKEMFEKEKEGIKVVINGNMEIKEIILNSELNKEKQEQLLKNCINELMAEVKMTMAKKLSGLGL